MVAKSSSTSARASPSPHHQVAIFGMLSFLPCRCSAMRGMKLISARDSTKPEPGAFDTTV